MESPEVPAFDVLSLEQFKGGSSWTSKGRLVARSSRCVFSEWIAKKPVDEVVVSS